MVVDALNGIDHSVTLWLNSINSVPSDYFWMFFSSKTVWIPFYCLLVYMIFKRLGWKRALVVCGAILLTILCCDQFSNFLKHTVGRLRPCYDTEMLQGNLHMLENKGGLYGFYSSHAANSFGLATCSYLCFRNDKTHSYNAYRIWAFVWAGLVSLSRVFVGKHFFGDILAGTAFGLLFGCCLAYGANFIIKKYIKAEE